MKASVTGFTIIEILVFLVVSSLLMTTILFSLTTAMNSLPATQNQMIAAQTARKCMEWYLEQRRLLGYGILTCPSTPSPSACSAPSGFTVSSNISCTTWNSDTGYKTITVTVSGLSNATLSTQIGNY